MAQLLKKVKLPFNLGELVFFIDAIIIIFTVIVFNDIEVGLYSTLAIFISSKVIDIIFEGIYFSKAVYVISDKANEISDKILKELERGITRIKRQRNVYK